MAIREYYEKRKEELLNDKSINASNRALFKKLFDWKETKLKRRNSLAVLDEGCYKTLLADIQRFRNANIWFKNKAWKQLTKKDIETVYNNLEDGIIKTRDGNRFRDRKSYYTKVFRSKPFEMAGKRDLAREVIEFYGKKDNEVRYVEFETFKKIVSMAIKPSHKLLLWLLFDVGENIFSMLQTEKRNFTRQVNKNTNEPEYLVLLEKEILKRTRTERTERTLHAQTVELLDLVLQEKKDNEKVFDFDYRAALKMFNRACKKANAKTQNGLEPTPKDLRSGMAMYLLDNDWSIEEINGRLGHTPASQEINKYVTYKSKNTERPKQKIHSSNIQKLTEELEQVKAREKLYQQRLDQQKRAMEDMEKSNNEKMVEMEKRNDAKLRALVQEWLKMSDERLRKEAQ